MKKNAIILGVDPGTTRIGYGLVKKTGNSIKLIVYGVIETDGGLEGLKSLEKRISLLVKKYKPDIAAVEKLYFSKNRKTALSVAEARGVILLALSQKKLKIFEYAPNEVKAAVCGSGTGNKKTVAKYVALTLGVDKIEGYDDAADALAIAIRACFERVK